MPCWRRLTWSYTTTEATSTSLRSTKSFLKLGWLPPRPFLEIDLLQSVRSRFRLTSNKLDFVAQFLGLGQKTKHKGMQLWKDCIDGDAAAWEVMEEYNKQDVVLLEDLYLYLLPWISNHPNLGLYGDDLKRRAAPTAVLRCRA